MRWARPLALCCASATTLCVIAAAVEAAIVPTKSSVGWAIVGGLAAALSAGLGLLIAGRARRAEIVGVLLALVGLTLGYTAAREGLWDILGRHPGTARSLGWLVALLAESSIWVVAAIALLLLFFPDGHLPSRRWRFAPAAIVAAAAVHHAFGAVDSAPYQRPLQHLQHAFAPAPPWLEAIALLCDIALLALLVAAAASVPLRARRADDLQRRQLKWLALSGIGVPVFILVCLTEVLTLGHPSWTSLLIGTLSIGGIPIAVAIGILRHDLYDVDRAVATTVAYVGASAVLLATFGGALLTTGLLASSHSTPTAVAVTAVAALAFAPLRRRLQTRVDRRLYPQRRAALAAVEALTRGIHEGSAVPEQLAEHLRVALRDPGLRVGYVTIGSAELVDATGKRIDGAGDVPIVNGTTRIGALLPAATPMSPQLLREVAETIATLVELVRLRLELTSALREVEASRSRLVQATDSARRRVARDLHDGAQQRLVSLGMALRIAQRHLDDGDVDMSGMIDQAVAELGTAVAELREIAQGLRPSTLDDGLPAALRALTRHTPIPIEISVDSDELPDDVAVTLYFVASEAITNAIKHGEATRIGVSVARMDGHIELRVTDDGRGGATVATGSGLAGLRDRLDALGGRLILASDELHGTVVEALVPCAS
jgi:signal transduction histidine kinase